MQYLYKGGIYMIENFSKKLLYYWYKNGQLIIETNESIDDIYSEVLNEIEIDLLHKRGKEP